MSRLNPDLFLRKCFDSYSSNPVPLCVVEEMRRLLEELYFDNINPNDQTFTWDSAYGKAVHTMSENEDKLTKLLEGKKKKLFLDLVNAQSLVEGTTTVENFIRSLRLGSRITIEIMSDEDGCLREVT